MKTMHILALCAILPVTAFAKMGGIMSNVVPSDSATGGKSDGRFYHLQYPSWGNRTHFGVDIWDYRGSPILATFNGEVVDFYINHPTFGNAVLIKHPQIKDSRGRVLYSVTMHYDHLSETAKTRGAKVVGGDTVLGGMGDTGGANHVVHTHFELRWFNTWTNPKSLCNGKPNVYACSDVRSQQWAQDDWEDPETFTIPQLKPEDICPAQSCDISTQTFSTGEIVGWYPKGDCMAAQKWFTLTEKDGVLTPQFTVKDYYPCQCK